MEINLALFVSGLSTLQNHNQILINYIESPFMEIKNKNSLGYGMGIQICYFNDRTQQYNVSKPLRLCPFITCHSYLH